LFGARVTAAGSVGGRDFTEVDIAGDTYRLISPPATGRVRPGVASIDFSVADLAAVRPWARDVGVPVIETADGRLALPEELNLGTRVEFVQG
jgi:hypothetical protein